MHTDRFVVFKFQGEWLVTYARWWEARYWVFDRAEPSRAADALGGDTPPDLVAVQGGNPFTRSLLAEQARADDDRQGHIVRADERLRVLLEDRDPQSLRNAEPDRYSGDCHAGQIADGSWNQTDEVDAQAVQHATPVGRQEAAALFEAAGDVGVDNSIIVDPGLDPILCDTDPELVPAVVLKQA